jgi:uncharacterized protein (DUF433 family)
MFLYPLFAAYITTKELLQDCPELEEDDIRAALLYAS